MKTATLESKFPLLAVENGCIISKDADITVAYRVELPELFTLTRAEYESMHSTWAKAVKVLPNYSIVHKQDFFIEEGYKPDICKEDLSFLSRSFERHFNERPYLQHTCYLFLTKTTKEHSRTTSSFNALTRGFIIPKEMQDKETVTRFMECCGQFERIVNDSGLLRIIRLTDEEIIGSKNSAGIIEKYFSMSQEDATCLQDLSLGAGEMKVGDNYLCLHTLSDPEDLPSNVSTDCRYERLSTDRSDCRLSFAAPIGILLTCNHVVNQYLFIDDSAEILRKFEQTARNMHSLSRYSRSNQINREWIEEYLNEAHSKGLTSIRAHCNVMAWSDDREKLKRIKNDVGSQLALMEAKPRHNTVDVPTLFWAAIPGNAGDFPSEESFHTFIEQALCLFIGETSYKDSLSPFGIRMVDRLTGKPVHLDISDLPMKNGTITNRNKFILGPSGSGKSTLVQLIPRLYDVTGGSISLDGIDVRDMTLSELRRRIGYIPQQGRLFSGTVESNLKFAGDMVSDEDMRQAARVAQAEDFIAEREGGYDSPISQGGSNVSGGQRQRLAIARALAKKPEVLVFDDSFSALDYKADARLREELAKNVTDAALVVVAQRIATIMHADQIIVLDDGHVVGTGTHKELLRSCPAYLEIAQSQLSAEELGLTQEEIAAVMEGGER